MDGFMLFIEFNILNINSTKDYALFYEKWKYPQSLFRRKYSSVQS